jgi:hypothetical protein
VKKSHAMIASAWERRNYAQDGPCRRGAGSIPCFLRISQTVNARPAQANSGRAALRRSRSRTWRRSSKITASFHTEDPRDSPTHAGTRTAKKNTNRRHTADDHRGADTKTATPLLE